MPKYELTTTQRFIIETDDIRSVLDNMEFTTFPVGVIGEPEFVDGDDTYQKTGLVPCPRHDGAYDCTPFCEICAGEQEYESEEN